MAKDKGKFNKRGGKGGGSSRFHAESEAEIEIRNARLAEFDEARSRRRAEAEEDGDENNKGDDEETEHGDEMDTSAKKLQKGIAGITLEDGDDEDNLNQDNGGGVDASNEPRPMTRKEREEAEKERAAAEYRRRHELGLTEEYKRDMAKLAEVRKRREEAAKRVAEEKETMDSKEKEARLRAEKMGVLAEDDDDDDSVEEEKKKKKSSKSKTTAIPKLDKIVIKKMKPTQLQKLQALN